MAGVFSNSSQAVKLENDFVCYAMLPCVVDINLDLEAD